MTQLIIDGHRHLMCLKAYKKAMRLNLIDQSFYDKSSIAVNFERAKDWFRKMTDVHEHIADLTSTGIDIAILEPSPMEFYYHAEPDIGAELCRIINENTARFINYYPEHLLGLATIPLQDIELAIEELNYAIENLNLNGVAMVSNIRGHGFNEEQFIPFFEEVEKLNLPIFIHPTNPVEPNRLHKYYLINFLGFPIETTIFATQLVFSGVLDRCPHLKICLAHAGGVLPFLLGRLEHGQSVRPEAQETSRNPFSYYLKNFYVDSITFRPDILRFVISIMPNGHVFMGTDYPFDMADMDPVNTIKSAISGKDLISDILGGNISRLIGISNKK